MYGEFADLYEKLQDIDYEAFADYIEKIFESEGIKPGLVLDLACGNGTLTTIMAKRGYEMIGVDMSCEMLDIAKNKSDKEKLDILYLNQDMTDFELYGTVDAIICTLDGINYLTEDGELERTLRLAKNYLNPGGIMIFDINTEHKLSCVLGNNTFVNEEKGIFYVWQNDYDEEEKICRFYLDFFEKQSDGTYRRYTEEQAERAYSESEIREAAEKSGLTFAAFYDEFSFKKPRTDSERCFVVLRNI